MIAMTKEHAAVMTTSMIVKTLAEIVSEALILKRAEVHVPADVYTDRFAASEILSAELDRRVPVPPQDPIPLSRIL